MMLLSSFSELLKSDIGRVSTSSLPLLPVHEDIVVNEYENFQMPWQITIFDKTKLVDIEHTVLVWDSCSLVPRPICATFSVLGLVHLLTCMTFRVEGWSKSEFLHG